MCVPNLCIHTPFTLAPAQWNWSMPETSMFPRASAQVRQHSGHVRSEKLAYCFVCAIYIFLCLYTLFDCHRLENRRPMFQTVSALSREWTSVSVIYSLWGEGGSLLAHYTLFWTTYICIFVPLLCPLSGNLFLTSIPTHVKNVPSNCHVMRLQMCSTIHYPLGVYSS